MGRITPGASAPSPLFLTGFRPWTLRRPAPLRLASARPAERPQPQAHVFTAEGLKALRKRKGLSQVQLAQLLGVSQGYLSQVEKGRKPIGPAADRILKWVMEQENE